MRFVPLLLVAACGSNDAPLVDAPPGSDPDAHTPSDAPMVTPDAPPSEVCSSGGWCQVAMPPNYTWAMSITPDGQPWTVAYGVRAKSQTGWNFYDLSWKDLADPFIVHSELYTVHALSSTDVWVGGRQGYVGHFNGASWQEYRVAAPWPRGIWGASANDVWVLYDSGLRYRWNGTALQGQPTSDVRYAGAWGTAANDVWGFGETVISNKYYPAIDHYDGTTWTRTVLPGFGRVISMWAASSTDIYAVISDGSATWLVHGGGSTWATITLPAATVPYAVWGRSASDVWVVGKAGAIVHSNGTNWTASASGTTKNLVEVGGTATTLWTAGDAVVLRKP